MPDDDETQGGWDAINRALKPLYGAEEPPYHFAPELPAMFGGDDPLQGISVYPREEPIRHWHFVTYGFTELFQKESSDIAVSGYGFELTLRLTRGTEDAPPPWALNLLQNLARYVFKSGNGFAVGHYFNCNGPIALGTTTELCAILFARDPELSEIVSTHGKAESLQVVGITLDEQLAIRCWNAEGFAELLGDELPLLCTDLRHQLRIAD
jgi:suppressor of fused